MSRLTFFAACLLLIATQQALSQTLTSYCRDRTDRGSGFSAPCATSYSYKGVTYTNACTRVDHSGYWCATVNGPYVGLWGNCLPSTCQPYCNALTEGGTAKGAPCVLPFTYKNIRFSSCTSFEHNKPWCATKATFDGNWGNCVYNRTACAPYCTDRTAGGSANGAPCVVPFTYKGRSYEECTNTEYTKLWCSTTATYNGGWGECLPKDCKKLCTDRTVRGNSGNGRCVFPFIYKGVSYTKCTEIDNNRIPWCSTTANYDNDKKYGACVFEC